MDVLRKMFFVTRQARKQMEEQVVEKSSELEQYWQRTQELEEMYSQLKEALEDERRAKQDEEAQRKVQARYSNRTHTHVRLQCVGAQLVHPFCSQAAERGGEQETRAGGDLQATAGGFISVSEGERRAGAGAI